VGLAFVDVLTSTHAETHVLETLPGGGLETDAHKVTFSFTPDPLTFSEAGSIEITYRVVVLNIASNHEGVALKNHAVFSYGDPGEETVSPPQSTTVHVIEPKLDISKTANTSFISDSTPITFTLSTNYVGNSGTYASDIDLTDQLPPELTYQSGTVDCGVHGGSIAADGVAPFATVSGPVPPLGGQLIAAHWTKLEPGEFGECTFDVVGNSLVVPGHPITNPALVKWTSLPGPVGAAQTPNNDFSNERSYDPSGTIAFNNYGTATSLVLNSVGGGGGGHTCKREHCFQIPVTGFTPGVVTKLTDQSVAAAYDESMGVQLRIPKLKLDMPIVGVPLVDGIWKVDWLTGVGGWLQQTAFPGLAGNSVITSHVTTRYGSDGPFAHLHTLSPGDKIFVTSFGRMYIYQVKSVGNVVPDDISVLKHETKPVLTLVTCSKYNEVTKEYDARIVVHAVLVQVNPIGTSGR